MKSNLSSKVSRLFNNAGLHIKKHSPEILMVAGIAGTVASTVLACKATTKIDGILNETKQKTDIIHNAMEKKQVNGQEYTENDGKKDLTIVYTQAGVKLVKLYAPAIALGVVSITSIVAGHKILKGRNLALAAAYTAVDKGFKQYRKNVVNRFGEEVDKELRYSIKAKEFEVEEKDNKGTKVVKKEVANVIETNEDVSIYARIFEPGNIGWEDNAEYNLMFLRKQQEYANERLRSKGHVFLNEVYDWLGFPRSKAGQSVGWVYNEKNPVGDNYIDFGIYNINKEKNRDFVNGYEKCILLDFNVDGNILDLI